MALHDIPRDVLHLIMRQLAAEDLAALSAQNKFLRSESGAEDLWKPLVELRWPECCTASAYQSRRSLYSSRAALPVSFGLLVDRLAKLQLRMAQDSAAAGSSHQVFEETMRTVFCIGPLLDLAPAQFDVQRTAEHKRLISVVCWWLEHKPKLAVAFVRETSEMVLDAHRSPLLIRWRRSAIAFLADLLRRSPCQELHPSVFEALRAATAALNLNIRHSIQRAALPASAVPCGLPRNHWWWQDSSLSEVASPA